MEGIRERLVEEGDLGLENTVGFSCLTELLLAEMAHRKPQNVVKTIKV